jgi:hypothetical protein
LRHELDQVGLLIGFMPGSERELRVDLVAQNLRDDLRLRLAAFGRDLGVELLDHAPCLLSSTARAVSARMRKLSRHDAAGVAECTPSVSTSTVRSPPTSPRSDVVPPQLLVVPATRVEAHDQARRADARRQVIDVGRQVEAAALFAGLDQHDAARVRDLLRYQRLDRRQRREGA